MEVGRSDELDLKLSGADGIVGGNVGTHDFQAEQTCAEFGEHSEVVVRSAIRLRGGVGP